MAITNKNVKSSGAIAFSKLNVASSIGVASLTTNLKKGHIPLSILDAREVNSGTGVITGALGSGTTPVLDCGSATNLTVSLTWAASNGDTICFPPVLIPDDCDQSENMTLVLLGKMGGSTDTPTVAARIYADDTASDLGGATSAFGATLAEETKAFATGGSKNVLSICLTPGAHTTDTLAIYAAKIEYTRKD